MGTQLLTETTTATVLTCTLWSPEVPETLGPTFALPSDFFPMSLVKGVELLSFWLSCYSPLLKCTYPTSCYRVNKQWPWELHIVDTTDALYKSAVARCAPNSCPGATEGHLEWPMPVTQLLQSISLSILRATGSYISESEYWYTDHQHHKQVKDKPCWQWRYCRRNNTVSCNII